MPNIAGEPDIAEDPDTTAESDTAGESDATEESDTTADSDTAEDPGTTAVSEFWVVLENCVQALPERLAEAFTLRMMDDREPDEVCKVLSITPTNLWVTLHRARARLRACLESNWFNSKSAEVG